MTILMMRARGGEAPLPDPWARIGGTRGWALVTGACTAPFLAIAVLQLRNRRAPVQYFKRWIRTKY